MASAVPARFAPDPQRRALIAKVHIAKAQLGLDPDTYEGVLMRVAGVTSAKDCSDQQLRLVVEDFTRRGFTSKAKAKRPGQPRRADHAVAGKARALWISLSLLCALDTPPEAAIANDKALEAFAKRQLGCDRLQWADQAQADRLIEALKAIAERHGWDQSTKGVAKAHYIHVLKVRLCDAILFKLKHTGIANANWTLGSAAFRLCGMGSAKDATRLMWTPTEVEQMAAALGRHLRTHGGPGAFLAVSA